MFLFGTEHPPDIFVNSPYRDTTVDNKSVEPKRTLRIVGMILGEAVAAGGTKLAIAGFAFVKVSKSAYPYVVGAQLHHIISPYASNLPRFQRFLKGAQITAEDIYNKVYVTAHYGPHPPQYHNEIFRRLSEATEGISSGSTQYRNAVIQVLKDVGEEAQQRGSQINKWLTDPR